jgi:hypothetical protein
MCESMQPEQISFLTKSCMTEEEMKKFTWKLKCIFFFLHLFSKAPPEWSWMKKRRNEAE